MRRSVAPLHLGDKSILLWRTASVPLATARRLAARNFTRSSTGETPVDLRPGRPPALKSFVVTFDFVRQRVRFE